MDDIGGDLVYSETSDKELDEFELDLEATFEDDLDSDDLDSDDLDSDEDSANFDPASPSDVLCGARKYF
jgi:hypothetical protein